MKRFFPVLERDGCLKRQLVSQEAAGNGSLKKNVVSQEEDAILFSASDVANAADPLIKEDDDPPAPLKSPSKFMSWNANSLILRLKNNLQEIIGFLQRHDPDVIAIQEVRIPAAGRKGEPKNPAEMKDDTSAAREDKQVMMRILSRPPFNSYKIWWSLADTKYGGTALFVKQCFQPLSVTCSFDKCGKHETDGRVILAEFENLRLLNTYAPNNGWREEELSFQRRRKWDQKILEFVRKPCDKPLIWCGDLNVSHEDIDVSHPEFFKNAKLQGYVPPRIEDCGQPGFTQAERQRFTTILKEGGLIDTYRWMHKQQDMEGGFSWSGHPIGKYRGKRMRIDYFLISKNLLPKLLASDIHGRGIELEGFYGSDHCPITMEMSM